MDTNRKIENESTSLIFRFRNLKIIYKISIACFIFAVLLVCNFFLVKHYQNVENKEAELVVNIVGRNRMLSQRVAITVEKLMKGQEDSAYNELKQSIELHEQTLLVLKNGGFAPGVSSNIKISPASDRILPIIADVEKVWEPYRKSAEVILNASDVRHAVKFIGDNYSKMLEVNNQLVQAFVSYYGSHKETSSETIDIAGRNRMLSQRIGLIAQRLYMGISSTDELEELVKAINLHDSSLKILKDGGRIDQKIISSAPMEVIPYILNVEELWAPYKKNTEIIIENKELHSALEYVESNFTNVLNADINLVNSVLAEIDSDNKLMKSKLSNILFFVMLLNFAALIFIMYIVWEYISKPLKAVADVAQIVASGDVSQSVVWNGKDEVGTMASSINDLIFYLKASAEFASAVGEGDFQKSFHSKGDKDMLGIALTTMREKLVHVAVEDKKRSWTSEGIAKFSEILRSNNENICEFSDQILEGLVKYMGANQGSIFIKEVNFEKKELELTASYAWERKKYLNKTVSIGEGLVGRCWQEGERIYITDVPDNYISITSGLGESNPKSILIIPMKIEDEVFGVIEIASFNQFEDYQIEFIEKLAESIASTISNTKTNIQTAKLLDESKEMTEQLQAHEEEMRQSMEEMQATQEEMERAQREMDAQHSALNNAAIVSETDKKGFITYVNDAFCEIAEYDREELIGLNHNIVRHPDMPKEAFKDLWSTIGKGNVWKGRVKNKKKGGGFYWVEATITPVLGDDGKPEKYIGVRFDITPQVIQEEEIQQQIEEMRAQEEEIRQNMEEMQATQEEMDRAQHEMLAQHNALNNAAIVSETDKKGFITYVNDAFCEIAEYGREELIGQNHNIVRHPDMPKEAFKDLWATIGKGNVWKGRVKNKKKGGGFYWVEATITPIIGDDGKPERYIGVRFDITDQIIQEEKIQSVMEQAQAKEIEQNRIIDKLKNDLGITGEITDDVKIVWSNDYSVGINSIDNQHKKLIIMINKLFESMQQGRAKNELEAIIQELVEYTSVHFNSEEKLFDKYNYPETKEHKNEHLKFVDQVLTFQREFIEGNVSISVEIIDFLTNWLINHIQGTDKKYTSFLKDKGVK